MYEAKQDVWVIKIGLKPTKLKRPMHIHHFITQSRQLPLPKTVANGNQPHPAYYYNNRLVTPVLQRFASHFCGIETAVDTSNY